MCDRSLSIFVFALMIAQCLRFRPLASAFCRVPPLIRSSKMLTPRTDFSLSSYSKQNNFSGSSWMDKNSQMESYPDQDQYRSNGGSRGAEKQKRRRNQKRREDFNVKQDQNFRDNFRGTRVFVQGLPSGCSWQDLKDHMKIAGEVVFASVSIDPDTGRSKGCGVVQYESTAGAQNAIKTMRDHPLDGYELFVREDFQESRGENRKLGERRVRGPTPPSIWTCADEANLALLSEEDSTIVKNLIKAREQARKRKNYETSDNIREDLKSRYAVHLDDRKKMWWVSPDNKVPQSIQEMKGEGRWGKQTPWRQIPTTPENVSNFSEAKATIILLFLKLII